MWKIEVKHGRNILTTGGGQVIDVTEMEYEPTLMGYNALSLKIDIQAHNHYIDCRTCNGKLQAYNDFRGAVMCERCIRVPQIAVEVAESIENPWFDFLAQIKNPKLNIQNNGKSKQIQDNR